MTAHMDVHTLADWPDLEAEAIAAWNRRAVPMEAVAWRWRVEGVGPWIAHHGPDKPSFSMYQPGEVYDLQALYTPPPQPDDLPGELREKVAPIIEAAIERHNPGKSLRHTLDEADAILSLIQSERGGA